jgi:hypothetical protein
MTLVSFILTPLAKKSYQLVVFAFHEVVLFTALPFDEAMVYGKLTLWVYLVYFGVQIGILLIRFYDVFPEKKNHFLKQLEQVLVLK